MITYIIIDKIGINPTDVTLPLGSSTYGVQVRFGVTRTSACSRRAIRISLLWYPFLLHHGNFCHLFGQENQQNPSEFRGIFHLLMQISIGTRFILHTRYALCVCRFYADSPSTYTATLSSKSPLNSSRTSRLLSSSTAFSSSASPFRSKVIPETLSLLLSPTISQPSFSPTSFTSSLK